MIEPLFRPLITCPSAWFSLGCSTSFNYCCFVQTITVSKNCKFIESSSAYCPGVPGRFNILFHFVTITKLTITLSVADLLEPRLLPPTSISLPFRWLKELLKMFNENVFFFQNTLCSNFIDLSDAKTILFIFQSCKQSFQELSPLILAKRKFSRFDWSFFSPSRSDLVFGPDTKVFCYYLSQFVMK